MFRNQDCGKYHHLSSNAIFKNEDQIKRGIDHTKNVKTFPKIVVTYISYTHIGRHVVGDEKPSRFNLGGNPSAVWAIEEAAIMAKAQGAQLFVSSMSSLNH